MKKILAVLLLLTASRVGAFETKYKIGDLTLQLPFKEVSGVYLYDLFARETLLGAETPLISYRNLTGVVGAVTDMDGNDSVAGIPFVGAHVYAPEDWFTERFTVGLFYGRDFKRGENIGGFKASLKLWK